jgi:hypothetical protein
MTIFYVISSAATIVPFGEKSSIMLVEEVTSNKIGNSDGSFRPGLGAARVFEDFSFRFAPFEMTFGRTQST